MEKSQLAQTLRCMIGSLRMFVEYAQRAHSLSAGCLAALAVLCGGLLATAAEPPPLSDGPPAAGQRVRVTAPEYAETEVHHALYLPNDWEPGRLFPVIVEYPPNGAGQFGTAGTVEDTHLGFHQSGGEGFIWVTMPLIDPDTTPPSNATNWWGSGRAIDPEGAARSADYTKRNLVRILEEYGGDPARVFVTGFSRGAIASGYVGLSDDEIADIWLGFLPHSHHDGGSFTPDENHERLSRVAGRASLITYGERDNGAANSINAQRVLQSLGYPVEIHELLGIGHTDEWIVDESTPTPSVAGVDDARQRTRQWLQRVMEERPGTFSISGRVTTTAGQPLEDVRIQSGLTHWTFTDSDGQYLLPSLIAGERELVASHDGYTLQTLDATLTEADLEGCDFTAEPLTADAETR